MQVIDLYQTYADAVVPAGKDGGELSRWQRRKESGFLWIGESKTVGA